jgi:hypothetical protein
MTTDRVLDKNEVSIDGVRFRITGSVTQSKSSREEFFTWNPTFMGGIGKNKVSPNEVSDQAWWSTCQLGYDHQVVPAQLETTTASSGVTGSFTVGAIGELGGDIYVAFGTAVHKYNNVADSWESSVVTLPANATDAINFRLNDVVYLAFATTGGYSYTSDGITWATSSKDVLYFTFWDNRLWGVDNTGQLWYSYNIGAEQNDAQLPLPDGSVTDLFITRNAGGPVTIFATTTRGLYAHDNEFTQWRATELDLPEHPDNGRGSTRWRESTHIPSGLGVYQYIQGSNSAVVTVMGPDRNDGLPSAQRGTIQQLVGTHNDLLAILDSTVAPAAVTNYVTVGLASHRTVVISPNLGFSVILGWNGRAWESKWLSSSNTLAITYGHVSNTYGAYRLWWAHGTDILFMPIQRDIQNPEEIPTMAFVSSAELITPWLEPDRDADYTVASVRVHVTSATATETLKVDYAADYSTTWRNLGTISTVGITEYFLPSDTSRGGVDIISFALRLTWARGSTTTDKAVMRAVSVRIRKKSPPKYSFRVNLDLSQTHKDSTPKQLRAALLTALEASTFVLFSYRNDDGANFGVGDRRFYVDLQSVDNLEETGEDERGTSQVLMVEA